MFCTIFLLPEISTSRHDHYVVIYVFDRRINFVYLHSLSRVLLFELCGKKIISIIFPRAIIFSRYIILFTHFSLYVYENSKMYFHMELKRGRRRRRTEVSQMEREKLSSFAISNSIHFTSFVTSFKKCIFQNFHPKIFHLIFFLKIITQYLVISNI